MDSLPAPADPYAAVTNSDVIVSQSFDRGRTWSAPSALTIDGEPVARVLNPEVWPRYAARYKEMFGFEPQAPIPRPGFPLARE